MTKITTRFDLDSRNVIEEIDALIYNSGASVISVEKIMDFKLKMYEMAINGLHERIDELYEIYC